MSQVYHTSHQGYGPGTAPPPGCYPSAILPPYEGYPSPPPGPPGPTSYQGYFENYPPPPPNDHHHYHYHREHPCFSFLKGCLAALCCCCALEQCCSFF
ncbi:protein CYSTEINE-RICH TRANSMEMBRANE MODULE 13-like [Actinidia eriantha]|uniref:protein CYSTEINE-RICH TRANSMEMBRANE MODULE 13-like n=1 Tax=Actinidia eriantha TaxID=165200 RepID=UPI0025895183|nr:protein CYSTEINE-RICH TRANSMEMBRANE MODULE 13-like [Actinidia eriantha]